MNRYVRLLILSLLAISLGCGEPTEIAQNGPSSPDDSVATNAPSSVPSTINSESFVAEPGSHDSASSKASSSPPSDGALPSPSNPTTPQSGESVQADAPSKPTSQAPNATQPASSLSENAVAQANNGTQLRIATFNCSLYRKRSGELSADLASGDNDDAHRIAHIIQMIRPDVLLLNEFDYDTEHTSIKSLRELYLNIGHDDAKPIDYPHYYTDAVNTGEPSGVDLDNDGNSDGWNDSFGFGRYPGQYGMVVLSRFPIDTEQTRTFRKLLWKDMHAARLPKDPATGELFYSAEAIDVLRISSKSHWDVAIDVEGSVVHFLVSHPTPPVFDGPEDRNGKRNHDEIRLFADYIAGDPHGYITDDDGRQGGLKPQSHFVIAGDLNADPNDGASHQHAIRQLTEHPLVHSSPTPESEGATEQASKGANREHVGDPKSDTADFDDRRTGNLRADYVLPSKTVRVVDCGVFWPKQEEPGHELISVSDHRLVWIDIEIP